MCSSTLSRVLLAVGFLVPAAVADTAKAQMGPYGYGYGYGGWGAAAYGAAASRANTQSRIAADRQAQSQSRAMAQNQAVQQGIRSTLAGSAQARTQAARSQQQGARDWWFQHQVQAARTPRQPVYPSVPVAPRGTPGALTPSTPRPPDADGSAEIIKWPGVLMDPRFAEQRMPPLQVEVHGQHPMDAIIGESRDKALRVLKGRLGRDPFAVSGMIVALQRAVIVPPIHDAQRVIESGVHRADVEQQSLDGLDALVGGLAIDGEPSILDCQISLGLVHMNSRSLSFALSLAPVPFTGIEERLMIPPGEASLEHGLLEHPAACKAGLYFPLDGLGIELGQQGCVWRSLLRKARLTG